MKNNAIVGQSGGPTSVINSSLAGVFESAINRGVDEVYGMINGIQGLLDRKYINMSDYIVEEIDIELLKRTPASFLGSCRYKLPNIDENETVFSKIFEILDELDIGYFFYIGGNDSMDTTMKLSAYGEKIGSPIRFIGVPKTIDNDLAITDHTPGYGSAAKFIASVTKEIILDGRAYDLKNATIVEVMGRNAGWLTGAAALSIGSDCEGPDLIFLPEYSINIDEFIEKSIKILERKPLVVVVSEGLKIEDGRYVSELASDISITDAFGHKMLTGTARYLAETLMRRMKCKARSIELSTIQRCASHMVSRVDITEAYQVGGAAVKAALEGETAKVIILKRESSDPYICTAGIVDVGEIANIEKKVPLNWINSTKDFVTSDFIRYASPLVQSELTPFMVSGLPQHISLNSRGYRPDAK
ncbi:MAG: 6-phosphofructokinase [Eubacterium sp.]|jgi:6-phosphofructokinase 1|nr:6-phosphofructokinase [Eubacterium sp.]